MGRCKPVMGAWVGHVCMGFRISVVAPQLCKSSVSGLDEHADGCLFEKGADRYPFCLIWGHRKRGLGGGWWVREVLTNFRAWCTPFY